MPAAASAGNVRRASEVANDTDRELRLTSLESLAVAQFEPARADATRAGRRFMLGNSAAITGIANVTALPTTAAQWAITNNEPVGGKSYFLEEIGMYLTSGTPGVGGILLACLFSAPAQSGLVAGAKVSLAGRPDGSGGLSSAAAVKTGVTITTPAAPNWYPIAVRPDANVTAFAGSVFLENRNVEGAIEIRPGQSLGLAVVSPAGTSPLFAPFAQWVELASDNE